MLAHEIRRKYVEFFRERGHLNLPSAPLVPVDALGNPDNSTLFTGSGMQQFKPYFIAAATPPSSRVSTVQKCIRTNDIDSVGDFSHCTFFEMLGNFSFGDYFKAEVIPWTWEFLTEVVGLDPDRFCVTIFVDDEEAFDIWHSVIGLSPDRIHRLGEDKNFWPANVLSNGPDGPCGPNSEIFYCVAPLEEMTTDPAMTPTERFLVDDNAGRWLEVWNNVFTQFDRGEDANRNAVLTPLPKKNNDTGAGLDRIAYASQGKTSVFETDLFGPTLEQIANLAGKPYNGSMSPEDFAFRVVAEHTRCMVFCIADGILPSNEGRGYVLRYIMRRAVRYGRTVLGFAESFLHEIAPTVIAQMGEAYPELIERRELIMRTIRDEEERFRRTLDRGMILLNEMLDSGSVRQTQILPGADAYKLYNTYGFPLDLTQELAGERKIVVDQQGYQTALREDQDLSRGGSNMEKDVFGAMARQGVGGANVPATTFRGYSATALDTAKVVALYQGDNGIETAQVGETVVVVLDHTPFYAESGGQVGDTGTLAVPAGNTTPALKAEISDTRKNPLGIFLHTAKILEGEIRVGESVQAQVDGERRRDIMRNHTATHLLQAALRQTLGSHVHQKGSLVAPDRLRFDFTHGQPMTGDELRRVEDRVNAQILDDSPVNIYTDIPIDEARARGAMALFGEKYGDRVRMVEIPGFSLELCGGTHLAHTSSIGLFKIVSESGVSSGVRRIEAVTGRAAYAWIGERENTLAQIAALLKTSPANVLTATEKALAQRQELEKQIRQLRQGGAAGNGVSLAPQTIAGVAVVVSAIENADSESLANLADSTAQKLGSGVVVLGSVSEGKVQFAAKVTKDLTTQGFHAGNIVREVAKIAGGGGGGRPDFATAGGRDPGKLQAALDAVPGLVEAQKK